MIDLVRTEFLKYKRYNILWFGITSVLFSIFLAMFQLIGTNDSVVSYAGLSEGVVWNHFSLFLPFTFTLIVGYSINREYTDHTLKNILVIPVSKFWIILSKIIAGCGLVILETLFSFAITLILAVVIHCHDIGLNGCVISLKQLLVVSICCYIAVIPVIIFSARKQNKFFSGVIFSLFYSFCGIFYNVKDGALYVRPAISLSNIYRLLGSVPNNSNFLTISSAFFSSSPCSLTNQSRNCMVR